MEFAKRIDNADVNEMPLRSFHGSIHLISSLEEANAALPRLASQKELGFDTETRPAFKKGINNQVALLQLSTPHDAFLFRLNRVGLPDELLKILSDSSIVKVGAAIRDDIKSLISIQNFTANGFVDLQNEVKKLEFESFSLRKLTAIVLGFRISKSQQLSNWDADELSQAQRVYAATDAWVSLMIYKGLRTNSV